MAKILDLIYRVKDQASAPLRKIKTEQQGFTSSVKSALPIMGAAAGAVVGLEKKIFDLGMSFMDSTIAIGDFGVKIGATTEQASALLEMAEDLDLDVNALEKAFIKMSKEGLDPSIDGLIEVRRRLDAATDPAERLELATKLMGKAGADLIPIFDQLTDEELRNYAKGMSEAQIRTDAEYQEMLKLREEMKRAEDTWESTKLLVGQTALEAFGLTDKLARVNDVLSGSKSYWDAFLESLGLAKEQLFFTETAAWHVRDALESIPTQTNVQITTYHNDVWGEPGTLGSELAEQYRTDATVLSGREAAIARKYIRLKEGTYTSREGNRAVGGPVSAGRSYVVGEEGAEVFTPGQSGQITPNIDQLAHSIDRLVRTLPVIMRDAVEKSR